jgi:hypothetical protein
MKKLKSAVQPMHPEYYFKVRVCMPFFSLRRRLSPDKRKKNNQMHL